MEARRTLLWKMKEVHDVDDCHLMQLLLLMHSCQHNWWRLLRLQHNNNQLNNIANSRECSCTYSFSGGGWIEEILVQQYYCCSSWLDRSWPGIVRSFSRIIFVLDWVIVLDCAVVPRFIPRPRNWIQLVIGNRAVGPGIWATRAKDGLWNMSTVVEEYVRWWQPCKFSN